MEFEVFNLTSSSDTFYIVCCKGKLLWFISYYSLSFDLTLLEYMELLPNVRPSLGAEVHELRQKLPLW